MQIEKINEPKKNIIFKNLIIPKQKPEKFYGNIEYKRSLVPKGTNNQILESIKKKGSQMLFRLLEGEGKALYILGIEDNGEIYGLNDKELKITLNTFYKIVNEIEAKIKVIRIYNGMNNKFNKIGYVCAVRIYLPVEILVNKYDNINGF